MNPMSSHPSPVRTGATAPHGTVPADGAHGPADDSAPATAGEQAVRSGFTDSHAVVPTLAFRDHLRRFRLFASTPCAPPPRIDRAGRVVYGFAQPFLGIRIMFRDRALLGDGLAPALALTLFCFLVAARSWHLGPWPFALSFAVTFAALAPVPSILFARHYARLAARAHRELGLGERKPYLRSLSQYVWESISAIIVIAIGVFPLTLMVGWIPLTGTLVAAGVQAAWTVHWIIVEGLDTGRTLAPSEQVEQVEHRERTRPGVPWFCRVFEGRHRAIQLLGTPQRVMFDIVLGLSRHWRPEADLVERNPSLSMGFGLGTAVLLAIPGLNLFFRPALTIASVHMRARLDPVPLQPDESKP